MSPGGGAIPPRTLLADGERLTLGPRPILMGIVNASPDSFSDRGRNLTLEDRLRLARELLEQGAEILDVGGESGITGVPPVDPQEEVERVVPLIEAITRELGARVSVDTYKPVVARAAVAAGATIVNDVSGLRDEGLAEVCAETGAALVLMHTRARPKHKEFDRRLDGHAAADVRAFLEERMRTALECGVVREQLILDPGPDFGKTPAQTVEALRELGSLHALERPILLPVSRKDFIGAITGRPPRERLAGTLAAIADGVRQGAHVLRVHDVGAARDFLAVLETLEGGRELPPDALLEVALRRDPPADCAAR